MAETLAPGFSVSSIRAVLACADQRRRACAGLTSRRLGIASSTWKLLSADIGADRETDTESSLLLCQKKWLIRSGRARRDQLRAYRPLHGATACEPRCHSPD